MKQPGVPTPDDAIPPELAPYRRRRPRLPRLFSSEEEALFQGTRWALTGQPPAHVPPEVPERLREAHAQELALREKRERER
jgi:hypothetical protein